MVVIIDFLSFVFSLLMMGFVFAKHRKLDTLIFLLLLTIHISCCGRFMLSTAQTLETALWANRFIYMGTCYSPFLLSFILFRMTNIRIPRVGSLVMGLYSTLILALVSTVDYCDLYYKEVTLVIRDGYSFLAKEYGPLHILYPVMIGIYGLFLVGLIIGGLFLKKRFSFKVILGTGCSALSVIGLYMLEQILKVNVSVVSLGYLVCMLFIIKSFDRINMYDMTANIVKFVENRVEYGYIVLDNKHRYISCNNYIVENFPEVTDWVIDHPVPESESTLYNEVVRHFIERGWEDKSKITKKIDDKYFELDVRHIRHGRKICGYVIEFADRTLERKYYKNIENYNAQLEKKVALKTADILHIKDMMVMGMADMVESRDNNTGDHIKRTSAIIRIFSEKLRSYSIDLNLSENFLKQVEKAAPMHDLGKIAITDSILKKPGKFTEDEYDEMKRHTTEGAKTVTSILKGVEDEKFIDIAKNVALYHHEKWNGTGYPTGIGGTDIPIEARIMALADVFDALVSKRCYKEAFSYDKAFSIIEDDLGKHFDPQLGRIFLECREELSRI